MVDLGQLEGKVKSDLAEAVLNLDWPGYQEILRHQGPDYHYRPSATLLQQVVRRNPDPNSTRAANQIELMRHLILNQALDHDSLSRQAIFYRAILTGSLTAVKMLLAAGCTITASNLSSLLYRIKSGSDSDVSKAVFLIKQGHLDFNLILFDDVLLDDDECSIVDRIYDLDIDQLNRAVLSQGIDIPQDNVKWYQSGNLAKLLRDLGVLVD